MSGARGRKADEFSALKKRLQEKLPLDDIMRTLLEYEGDPPEGRTFDDRSIVLVAGAILEQFLEAAISSHFEIKEEETRVLFDDSLEGPLSSFAKKISLGYALGVYGPEMRSDMTCIRHIRNAFAHSKMRIDFETAEIKSIFDRLTLPKTRNFATLSNNQSGLAPRIFASTIRLICAYFNDAQRPMKYRDSYFYDILYDIRP